MKKQIDTACERQKAVFRKQEKSIKNNHFVAPKNHLAKSGETEFASKNINKNSMLPACEKACKKCFSQVVFLQ